MDTSADYDARIDGTAPHQPRDTENHGYHDKRPEWVGLRFEHCDDLTVRNLRIERTTAWGVKCEAGDDFEARNLHFEQDDTYINQDGVHVCGPASGVTVRNVSGETWDDAVVLNVGGAVDAYGPRHGGGPIDDAVIRDVRVSGHRPVRLFTERGQDLQNVEVANVDARAPVTNNAVELNASYADAVPDPDDVRDVRIRDVRAAGCDQAVRVESPATDLQIAGVTARNVRDAAVRFERPAGAVSVRGVEHRSDPGAVADPDGVDGTTATLRWTGDATRGDYVVRDVVAREAGPPERRRNVVVAGPTAADARVLVDGLAVRGAKRVTRAESANPTLRNVDRRAVGGD